MTSNNPSNKSSKSSRQFFGTDGIRGRVGVAPMTPDWVLKLGYAVGLILFKDAQSQPDIHPRVVIGRDTRLSGEMLESALTAGLSAAGVDIFLLGDMPTPGVAYLTRTFHAQAGIVISASHNPYYDNGIKFFGADGRKLTDETELKIEAELDSPWSFPNPSQLGKVFHVDDARGRYIEFCKASVPPFFDLKGLKIVVDCAHGATYRIAPNVFSELGAKVIAIGNQPDGVNINQNVGATATQSLQKAVIEHKAHLGIALDGDGDRVIMVDHLGQVVDGDQILYILACDSQNKGLLKGSGVVGTLMSNLALETQLKKRNIPFERAKVGDRYVMKKLHQNSWYIGGESSGHIIWLSSTTTGDGLIAALQILQIMKEQDSDLVKLLNDYIKAPQIMINLELPRALTQDERESIQKLSDQINQNLGEKGRALIRPSGTEPLLRVMVESLDSHFAQQAVDQAVIDVKSHLKLN